MVDGGGVWSAYPRCRFFLRLRETALEARFPSLNSDHDRGERRRKRAFLPSKNSYLAGGNHV